MHSANFKTKLRINAAFCAKIGYLSHAFLKYLKFQNHKCIFLQSQNKVESFWNNNTAFKVKIGSVSHNIACLFCQICLKFRNHRYISAILKRSWRSWKHLRNFLCQKLDNLLCNDASFLAYLFYQNLKLSWKDYNFFEWKDRAQFFTKC